MIVEFEDAALLEIQGAIAYSEGQFGLGEALSRVIQNVVRMIANDPFRFREYKPGIRIVQLPRFPFYLVFSASENGQTVRFFALGHTSRRPGYWKSRI